MARLARMVTVAVVLATVFVVVPAPTVAWASEMTTESRHPRPHVAEAPGVVARGSMESSASGGLGADHSNDDPADHHSSPVEVAVVGETSLSPFVSIGITVDRAPTAPVAFRVSADGVWSEWRELPFTEGHMPEGPENTAGPDESTSEPFWVGSATGYEIEVPADAGEVAVHLVREDRQRVLVEPELPKAGASDIAIHSRAEWGARAPAAPLGTAPSLELAVIHHSETSNSYSSSQVPSILRSIQAFHMDVNGWDDIAYNFAVDRFGRVWEARGGGIRRAIVGGHAYGFNTGTTGVVVLGSYTASAPTAASVDAVGELIAWKFAQHQTPPGGSYTYRSGADTHFGPRGTPVTLPRIVGHGDVRQTSCPGSLESKLGAIRSHVESRYAALQSGAPARPLAGDQRGDGRDDLLLYRPGAVADPVWSGNPGPSFGTSSTNVNALYEPLTGDFDGNGTTDVLWYAVGSAPDYLWLRRSDGTHRDVPIGISGQYEPHVGDFDGNGTDDVLWHGPYGSADYVWWFQAGGAHVSTPVAIPGAVEPLVGDFDGDGRSDLLHYGPGGDADRLWYGRSGQGFDVAHVSVGGTYRTAVGDFDGDGRHDILWFAPGSRDDYIWRGRSDRRFTSESRRVGGNYQPFVGDFDGNGRDDIFWFGPGAAPDYQWWHVPGGWVDTAHGYAGDHPHAVLDVDGDRTDEVVWLDQPTSGTIWSADPSQTSFRSTRTP